MTARNKGFAGLAVTMLISTAVVGPSSMASIDVGPGNGNPQTNESGKCPGGQNKGTSPGGLKKC